MLCTYAHLDEQKLEAIKAFEKNTGKVILAYACQDVDVDPIQDDELSKIKDLEGKLGLTLVAVKS